MLRNALFTLFILIVGKSYAQQDYFVLIQADNSQPFYVRLDDKTLSSNSKGRLILSQLKGGDHSMAIGFPKQAFPEQQFSFNIAEKDLEFQLKDLGEKGWGLFNPQTLELKTADKKERAFFLHSEGVKKDDAFSRLMAGVVSDTAVMYNTYALEEVLKDSPVNKPVAKIQVDSPAVKPVTMVDSPAKTVVVMVDSSRKVDSALAVAPPKTYTLTTNAVKTDTSHTNQAVAPPVLMRPAGTVVKLSERRTPKGLRIAFADRPSGRKADTVILIIPMDTGLVVAKTTAPVSAGELTSKKPDTVTVTRAAADIVKELVKDPVINKPDSPHTSPPAMTSLYRPRPDSTQKRGESKPAIVNSDCRNFASDYDVDKLRVKMLEISKDEDKILMAKKVFKTRCFTTRQIKALSEVFTSDAGKYRFFEAAYPFVSDDRFRELTDLLADPVYNGKFRAMTGQQ